MRQSRSHFAAGFTLLELVLVMLLIVAISAIVVPSLGNFAQGRQKSDVVDQIVALAGWARTQAISRGVVIRLNFDQGKNMYWLTRQNGASFENLLQDDASTTGNLTLYNPVGEEPGKQFIAGDGLSLSCTAPPQSDGQYVEFRPTGRCDPAIVKVVDRNGSVVEVGALSSTETWHVLSTDEQQQEATVSTATPALVR